MRDRSRAAAFLPLGLAVSLCLGLIGPGLIALVLVWDEQRRGIPHDGQELLGAWLIAMFVTFVAMIFAVTTLGARGRGPIAAGAAAVVAAVGAAGVLLLRSPLAFAIAQLLLVGVVLAVARPISPRAVIAGSVAGLSWVALALLRGHEPWTTYGLDGLGLATAAGLTLAAAIVASPSALADGTARRAELAGAFAVGALLGTFPRLVAPAPSDNAALAAVLVAVLGAPIGCVLAMRYASPAAAAVFLVALVVLLAVTGGIAPLVRF